MDYDNTIRITSLKNGCDFMKKIIVPNQKGNHKGHSLIYRLMNLYPNYFEWDNISAIKFQPNDKFINEEFVHKFARYINWEIALTHNQFHRDTLNDSDVMDCINATGNGSELILKYQDCATFNDVIKYVDSTKNRKYTKPTNWDIVSKRIAGIMNSIANQCDIAPHPISKINKMYFNKYSNLMIIKDIENFIIYNKDNLNWLSYLCTTERILTRTILEKCIDKLDWQSLILFQYLPEDFIEKHLDKIENQYWYSLCSVQILSEEFIERHSDKVDWHCILNYQNISKEFIARHSIEILEAEKSFKEELNKND